MVLVLEIGKVYRVTRNKDFERKIVDGYPNLYYEMNVGNGKSYVPRQGITNFAKVKAKDGDRIPFYLLLSENNKSGKNYNPWHDELFPDRGVIKYYGDSKPDSKESNNSLLIEQYEFSSQNDKEVRLKNVAPILIFSQDKSSGFDTFQGYGIIESVQLVTQYSEEYNQYFSNHLFTICVFSMASTGERFNWDWIVDRCNEKLSSKEANNKAPKEWKQFIEGGTPKIHLVRRNVRIGNTVSEKIQRPAPDSDLEKLLNSIYRYYDGRKHDFEALALEITKIVIEESGGVCKPGWITKKTGDGGYDFVLRIDIGSEQLSGLQIVVLGQAKCEDPKGNTNGVDIARTVARIKRGWVGAFVTTQVFSQPVQREIKEDNYPLLLINGKKIAQIVKKELRESEYSSLDDYLDSITAKYSVLNYKPEDILD